jgi:hypothetical protein
MVKRNAALPGSLLGLLVLVILMSGCSEAQRLAPLRMESLAIPAGAPSAPLSIAVAADRVFAIFSDRSTLTLNLLAFPRADRLPSLPPIPSVIDKIDVSTPLPSSFGAHSLAVDGTTLRLLFLDRESDAKTVLKMASLLPDATQWNLDVMDASGDPVALLAEEQGGARAYWSAGSLRSCPLPGDGPGSEVLSPFVLSHRAGIAGSNAFTAYSSVQRALFAVRHTAQGDSAAVVPGAGPVHASWEGPGGALTVLSWDEAARRIILQEQKSPGAAFTKTTVTLCDGTSSVAVLPGDPASGNIMLYDEMRPAETGARISQLSLLAPGSLLGQSRGRYSKGVIASGESPILGFAAARANDALYVVLLQDGLKLFRIALSSSP